MCQLNLQKKLQEGSLKARGKYINKLFIELRHPTFDITRAMGKAMGLKLNSIFKTWKDGPLGKGKKTGVSKTAVLRSKIKGKRLFIDIKSPYTVRMGSK